MGLFELATGLFGQGDPRDKVAAAMAYQRNPNPITQAAWSKVSGQPAGAPPVDATSGGAGGSVPTAAPTANAPGAPAGQQPPPPPPQPQAYTSPPDMVALYTELAKRSQNAAAFDRGLGGMVSALDSAHPQGAQDITNMMNAQATTDAGAYGPAFMTGAQGASDQMQTADIRQQGLAALPGIEKQLGLSHEQALMLFNNGQLDDLIKQAAQPTNLQKEYDEYVKNQKASNLPAVDLDTFRKTIGSGRTKYGLNVHWAPTGERDANGIPIYTSVQLADDGSAPRPALVNGKPISQPAKVVHTDQGDYFYTPDGLEQIGAVANDPEFAGKKTSSEERAKFRVLSETKIPIIEGHVIDADHAIDDILNDPELPNVTGNNLNAWLNNNVHQSEAAANLQQKIAQLRATNFANSYQELKGAQGITTTEEESMAAAYDRMKNPNLSVPDFVQAVRDYQTIAHRVAAQAYRNAGKDPPKTWTDPVPTGLPPGSPLDKKNKKATSSSGGGGGGKTGDPNVDQFLQ